jgi:hypothetical protein
LEGGLRERRNIIPDTFIVGIDISLEMTPLLNRASGAWGQYYSSERIILVLDVEGFLYTYNPLHWGCNWYGMSTHPNNRSGYLLTSQQLNLEDHATSDSQLLGLFLYLYGGFSAFRF